MRNAFTLIELLIVVAIIAILAAIAVPNFLEAQTRAKVSRAKSDIRSLVTATEAYMVDWNRPPLSSGNPSTISTLGVMGRVTIFGDPTLTGTHTYVLSTPVSYITNAYLLDPFNVSDVRARQDERLFTYQVLLYQTFGPSINNGETLDHFRNGYGEYRHVSYGPGRDYWNGVGGVFVIYDPTNGTVSDGNIFHSQKFGFDQPGEWEVPTFGG
jgi:prepilin-type N-terminal cleavage/methylation domain-containing protein